MSYFYKGQDIRPVNFKMQGKANKYNNVPVMRIISLEQPSSVEDCYKATVLLERVGVDLKWRSRTTAPAIAVIKAVMDGKLGLTNPSGLDKWAGWSRKRVFVDTGECILKIS